VPQPGRAVLPQAQSDALGSWGRGQDGQRATWENDGRIDLRSVTNSSRQLPYHVARHRGFRWACASVRARATWQAARATTPMTSGANGRSAVGRREGLAPNRRIRGPFGGGRTMQLVQLAT
jgi:hypothetical protein